MLDVKTSGAIGDGVTDDTSAISRAMLLANRDRVPLFFPPGRYVCNTIANSLDTPIIGAGADVTTIVQHSAAKWSTPIWSFSGTAGSVCEVAKDVLRGSRTIVLFGTALGINNGDLVIVSSGQLVDAMNSPDETIGQQVLVKTVVENGTLTTLTTHEPLVDTFLVADRAVVRRVEPLRRLSVRDLSFDNPQPAQTKAQGLLIAYATNVTVERVNATRMDNAALVLKDVWGGTVSHCSWSNFNNDPLSGRNPYGVAVKCASSYILVAACRADRVRHLFTTDGVDHQAGCPTHILVTDCIDMLSTNAGFDTHPAARYVTFLNCSSFGSFGPGLQARGRGVVFQNCRVVGARYGWRAVLKTQDCWVIGCTFSDIAMPPEPLEAQNDGGVVFLINHPAKNLKIIGNTVQDATRSFVRFASTSTGSDNVLIRGNIVHDACMEGLGSDASLVRGVATPVVTDLVIEDNRVIGSSPMRYMASTFGAGSSVLLDSNVGAAPLYEPALAPSVQVVSMEAMARLEAARAASDALTNAKAAAQQIVAGAIAALDLDTRIDARARPIADEAAEQVRNDVRAAASGLVAGLGGSS